MFYRNNCIKTKMGEDQIYVKDLRILNVDLCDVIIIDNSVLSFVFHMDNGIPILPFYDNKNDDELKFLIGYLDNLAQHKDLSAENKKLIPLEHFKQKVFENSSDDITSEDIFNSSKPFIILNY